MKKTIIILIVGSVLSSLFISCKKAEIEIDTPTQAFHYIEIFAKDANDRDLLSKANYAFKNNEIAVRFKTSDKQFWGSKYFNLIQKEGNEKSYIKLSLSEFTQKISETTTHTRYQTMVYVTFKNNPEKTIKILYDIKKADKDFIGNLIGETQKVWVDGTLAWEHDNTKEDLESYQSKITLTLNAPKR